MVPQYERSLNLEQQYQRMVMRQKVIEGLDARRSTSVLILNDLAAALPREVYLVRLSEDGFNFSLEGRSVEAAAIARFLEQLAHSAHLQQITLGELRVQDPDDNAVYQFSIAGKVRLTNTAPSKPQQSTGQ
jgi:Tfp pilus assembly protein PilN